jgi:hypothetical protein
MPIMAIYRASDVDRETFNRYRVELPIEPLPEGAILHLVAFGDDGLLGIDVWESEDQLKAFGELKMKPALKKMGRAWIEPTVLRVHELWAANNTARHNLAAPAP